MNTEMQIGLVHKVPLFRMIIFIFLVYVLSGYIAINAT